MDDRIGAVVVCHNNQKTIDLTLNSLLSQTFPPSKTIVVDCASEDTSWSGKWKSVNSIELVLLRQNLGFTGGSNIGWRQLAPLCKNVLFLNPDVLLPSHLLERLNAVANLPKNASFAILSPRLEKYSFEEKKAAGKIDSTGIFPHWYGAWQDRTVSSPPQSDTVESVPALCGAFLFCRTDALVDVCIADGELFDERYFAYKEDIELSLRTKRAGWQVGIYHGLTAFHGRGWLTYRAGMTRSARLLSAHNELRLHARYAPWRLGYSLIKWAAVKIFNR